ncbi:MAG: hypothetical protein ACFBSD_01960 [Paracoccaceae bacterium]
MQIDWFTAGAQLVNFFVLVWLLKRFLFRPVTDAIGARQAEIAGAFARAEAREAAAEEARRRLDADRATEAASLAARRADAETEAERYGADLRAETDAMETRLRQEFAAALERDRAAVHAALADEAGRAGIEIARQVLVDLADAPLETLLVRRLAARLSEETPLALAPSRDPLTATLTLRWPETEPDAALIERLSAELSRLLCRPVSVRVTHTAATPIGATLEADGMRADWTIEGHLDRVRAGFDAARNPTDPVLAR